MKSNFNFSNLDMYSKKIGFYFNNQEKIGSYFGAFLTIIYISISLSLLFYQIIKALKRKELRVYDTTIYSQEIPVINVDSNQFYFAFALEDPITTNRFIDERIYTAQISLINKKKIKDKFVITDIKDLEFEKCIVDNFGKNYQNLFEENDLSNSYCLKDFNFNLTLEGNYKYERMSYIKIRIFPCINSTKNKFKCKSQKEIDHYLTNGYFSIKLKDFGLNPLNYSSPVVPILKSLFTTIDKKLHKKKILNFRLSEIHTDTGLINEKINKKKYIHFMTETENFTFRDKNDFLGKSIISVVLKLDEVVFIHKRNYTKLSEMFSKIGGFMQIINTSFLLISSLINNLNSELKIINKIFDFNIKEKKMILKLQSLNPYCNKKSENMDLTPKKQLNSTNNIKQFKDENKSNNNLIIKENNIFNIPPLNIIDNKINENKNYIININNNKNIINFGNSKNEKNKIEDNNNIQINKENIEKYVFDIDIKEKNNSKDFKEHISLNIFDYFCLRKNSKKFKYIEMFNKSKIFYKKKIDIVRVFTLLSIIEDIIKR